MAKQPPSDDATRRDDVLRRMLATKPDEKRPKAEANGRPRSQKKLQQGGPGKKPSR